MLKYMGKLLGQMIPPIMATIIGAYLVQQLFPGKNNAETDPKASAPAAAVMSPTPMAPASKLAKGANSLSGPPAEPTEITGPNKPAKEPVKQAAAPAAAAPAAATPATAAAAAPATTGTIMPRRVGPPGPVPLVARERGVEPPPAQPPRVEAASAPPAREEVPPLELAAKVIAALPPSKPASPPTSPRDLPEARDGYAQPNAAPGPVISTAPLPPPSIAPNLSPPPAGASLSPPVSSAPMPITPPGVAAAPLPPPPSMQVEVPRAPITRDPVQLSDADREHLGRIPLAPPDGVEVQRRPSLFERGGALVKGVVSSVKSVLPGQQQNRPETD